MKKAIFISILMGLSFTINAQVFFGAGMWKYNIYDYPFKIKYNGIAPVAGYQHDHFYYGLSLYYSSGNGLQNGTSYDKLSTFSICPFVRYDLVKREKLDFFLEASYCFDIEKEMKPSWNKPQKENFMCFGLQPGIQYHFTPHWSVVAYWGQIAYSESVYAFGFEGWYYSFDTKSVKLDIYFNF